MQGVVQLTDMTQGVLSKPALHLKVSDSRALPGLSVSGFTWLATRCTSYRRSADCLTLFPFVVNMLKASRKGKEAKGVTAKSPKVLV